LIILLEATLKIVKCPHCTHDVHISIKIQATSGVGKLPERFPRTWREYAGKSFAEVFIVDKDYIIECIENEEITGVLRDGLEDFYNNIARYDNEL
jgi:hypothetical protein